MAYDPNTDIDEGGDIEGHAVEQDRQDAFERAQTSTTPALPQAPPSTFRQTSPGVYSPAPAPAPEATPAPTARPSRRAPPIAGDTEDTGEVYGFTAPPSPEKHPGWWHDMGQTIWQGTLSQGKDLVGAAQFAAQQMNADPVIRQHLQNASGAIDEQIKSSLESMDPRRQAALSASITSYFGNNVDANGNKIPTPGEVGWLNYFSLNAGQLIPPVLAAILPASLAGKVAVKGLSMLGVATKATEAATGLEVATRAAGIARTTAQAATTGGVFGAEGAGQMFDYVHDQLGKMTSDEKMKSPVYAELIGQGKSDAEATEALSRAAAPFIYAAGAVGAVAGAGFGGMLTGKLGAAGAGRVAGAAIGGAEGAITMGGQGAASTALEQGLQNQLGTRQGYDYNAILANAVSQGLPGLVLGAPLGALHGREAPVQRPGDVDPAAHAALTEGLPPPGGPGETPPGPGPGQTPPPGGPGELPPGGAPGERPPPTGPGELPPSGGSPLPPGGPPGPPTASDMSGVPGYSPPNEPPRIYPTTPLMRPQAAPEGEPTGIPGYSPPPAGEPAGGAPAPTTTVPPATQAAVARSRDAAVSPSAASAESMAMGKPALVDELATTAGAPPVQKLRAMSKPDLAKLRDRLNAGGQNTTVVNGAAGSDTATTPVRSESLGQAPSGTTAPPAARDLTPSSAPEGVAKPTTELTGQEPAEVRPEGSPAPGVASRAQETAASATAPPKVAEAIKVSKRAAQKAKMAGGEAVVQQAGHVEAPTEGSRTEAVARAREIQAREDALEAARDTAVSNVRDAMDRAASDVVPLHKGDPRIGVAVTKAVRDLLEHVGQTDGTMSLISKEISEWAERHEGNIPGTRTPWRDVADAIHRDVTGGKGLEGETYAREAAAQVEAQPRAVESETQKRQTEREEATTTKEQDIAREEAHAAGEATETSAGMTAAPETTGAKVAKGTSADVRGRQLVERALDPNDEMTPLRADREFGGQNTGRGRKRLAANADIRVVARKMLAEASNEKTRDRIIKDIGDAQTNQLLSEKEREVQTKRLLDDMSKTGPERIAALERFLREVEDPVGDAADKRAQLEAKMAERKGAPPEDPVFSAGPAKSDGVSPRSSRYVRMANDQRLSASFERALRSSEMHGVEFTTHDALRVILQDPLLRAEMRPLQRLAAVLLKRAPNIPVLTPRAALGRLSPAEVRHYSSTTYGLFHPERDIVVSNIDIPRTNSTHVETVLHEILHATTFNYLENLRRIDPNHKDLRFLRGLLTELKGHAIKAEHSMTEAEIARVFGAVKDVHELHTVLMSSPTAQGFAASRVASPEFRSKLAQLGLPVRESGRSVWRYFTDWVRRALDMGPVESASEQSLLDHVLRPLQDITDRAAEWNKPAVLPEDPVLRARAAPAYDTITQSLGSRTREAIARTDPAGLGDRMRRAILGVTNRDAIVDWNKDVLPSLTRWRTSDENIRASSNEFAARYGDDVQALTGRLNKADNKNNLNNLMTDVGVHEAHVGANPPANANVHLTKPEQQAALRDLQNRYNNLSAKDKAIYNDTKKLYNDLYADERKAQVESLLNGFMPEATQAQRDAFTTAVKSRESLDRFLADPDNSTVARAFADTWGANRAIARGMAQLHGMGFVRGDYFPLRRFGNYVVRYGDARDPANYGVEMFESYKKAQERRAELVRQGRDDVFQVARKDTTHLADLTSHPAFADELANAMKRQGFDAAHVEHVNDLMNDILLKHATHSEAARARMQRRGVRGASVDQARVLASDFVAKQARHGYLLHGLDRARRLGEMRDEVRAHEGPSGAPGAAVRAMNVYQEAVKRTTRPEEHDNLIRKIGSTANAFSFTQSLMSVSHMLTSTMETHGNSLALLGARHGYARTTLAITRALAEASPSISGGARNTIKALGNRLKTSDWNLVKAVVDEMASKRGADRTLLNMLSNELVRTGLVDHTQLQDIRQQMTPAGNIGTGAQKMWNIFYNSNAAMAHAVDVMNKLAVAKAAADLEMRKNGGDRQAATDYAIQMTRRVMPNYTIGNRERIATNPVMSSLLQFKRYGMHMYALMANLTREAAHGPNKLESAKALAGILATHSMMAGGLTLLADPLRYIGGAYDIATGALKFHDYENNVRSFLADTFGPEMGEIISRGLPHALGMDLHRRVGLANLLEVPEMDGFNKKGAAQVLLGLATGATGENLENLVDGAGKFLHGDVGGFLHTAIPRPFRDAYKGVELATQGLKDQTGKTILAPGKLSTGAAIAQGLGIQPAAVSEFREGRNAVLEAREEQRAEHTRLTQRWLAAEPGERQDVMQEIRLFNQDPKNLGARITHDQLLQAQQQARKQAKAPYGLRLPKAGARELLQAGAFANAPQ